MDEKKIRAKYVFEFKFITSIIFPSLLVLWVIFSFELKLDSLILRYRNSDTFTKDRQNDALTLS